MRNVKRYPFLHTFNPLQKINATTILERLGRKPHQLFQPHRTDFYMIFLFNEGHGAHSVDFNTLSVKPHHILFIAKGQVHQFDMLETYDGYTVIFTEDFFCRSDADRTFLHQSILFNDPLHQSYFSVKERYEELTHLYHFIVAELRRTSHRYQADILHHYLFNMLLIAESLYKPEYKNKFLSRQQQLAAGFKLLTSRHLMEHWTINQYACKLNVTPRTLQAAFAQVEDKTPKSWLDERLCLEIKRLLIFDTLSINEVAFQLGFKEATNFVKFFKTNTGITPSAFRQLHYRAGPGYSAGVR